MSIGWIGVDVGDHADGGLRLAVADYARRPEAAERIDGARVRGRSRGLRVHVVRVVVARMLQRPVARRVPLNEGLCDPLRALSESPPPITPAPERRPRRTRTRSSRSSTCPYPKSGIRVDAARHVEPLDQHRPVELRCIGRTPHQHARLVAGRRRRLDRPERRLRSAALPSRTRWRYPRRSTPLRRTRTTRDLRGAAVNGSPVCRR